MVVQLKPKPRRVAVIGAGAAGLVSAKVLSEVGHDVVVFEGTDCVGGTWVLREDLPGSDTHSSMYRNLHTNLPKEVMGFSDLPIKGPPGCARFPHHTVIREYLEEYATKFNLRRLIEFNTVVTRARRVGQKTANPAPEDGIFDGRQWEVVVRRGAGANMTTETQHFDAVLVCNGHYSKPYVPRYCGTPQRVSTTHSHWYREPAPYAGKTVVVVGSGSSGCDIAREISSVCARVYLCVADPERMFSPNVLEMPNVVGLGRFEGFDGNENILTAGAEPVAADAVLFCTGYYYDFPFFKGTPHDNTAHTNGAYVDNLYRHVIDIDEPTLSYIGLPALIVPFPLFEYQAHWVARVYAGLIALPSRETMRAELEEHREQVAREGKGKGCFHYLSFDQFAYNNMLADDCNQCAASAHLPEVPHVTQDAIDMYVNTRELRKTALGY